MKKIILIDGNSLMFRAYYATAYTGNLMQNRNGVYTNAIFAFVNMMDNILKEDFDNIFIAFDKPGKTFRHREYEEYKAGRKEFPEELGMQVPYIKEYLNILNIQIAEEDDFEADDLIATVATKYYDDFDEIKIISGDLDLLQLVNDKVSVHITRRGITQLEEYNNNNFYERMKIYPHQVIDYKGLVGDSADNLPGVRGIGEKTAIKLLSDYTNLEDIQANLEKLTGRAKTILSENISDGFRYRELARLVSDVNLEFSVADTKRKDYDVDRLRGFYHELDFSTFLRRLDSAHNELELDDYEFEIIDDSTTDFTEKLTTDTYLAVEVVGKNYYSGEFLGVGVVNDNFKAFLTKNTVLKNPSIQKFLASTQIKKTIYDYKKGYVVLDRLGIKLHVDFDIMMAIYLVHPDYASEDIKKATMNFLDSSIVFEDAIYGSKARPKKPAEEVYAKYSIDKARLIKEVSPIVLEKMTENKVTDLYYNCELPLVKVLAKMEIAGLKLDQQRLKQIGDELTIQVNQLIKEIHELADEEFNINSVQQLGKVLFEKLGLPHGKRTKTGFSTSADVLEKLADEYIIAQKVLDYRSLNKLITTYVNGLFDALYDDGLIHPLYKQALTVTGRLSSVEPNIQNMPIRTEVGQTIRETFVSRFEDGVILSADYSQIELRVLAHISQEPEMVNSFNAGFDFHSKTASDIFGVDIEEVTSDMRRTAKAINFGIIYGMSSWGLSENLKISPVEAENYINTYFNKYKQVKTTLDNLITSAREKGYSQTILERRRYIPELANRNNHIRQFGERTAMNAPIQGSAADIIKLAMIEIDKAFTKENLQSVLIAQVHDELLFDVAADEVERVSLLVQEIMENIITLKVKLKVDINIGKNWFLAQ